MAGDSLNDPGASYSSAVGFLFIFNLIVGTGALTLPKAFAQAGYVLGTVVLSVIGFMSYVSATFVLEAMSSANAVLRIKKYDTSIQGEEEDEDDRQRVRQPSPDVVSDHSPLLDAREFPSIDSSLFQIKKRVELGQMAAMFYNRMGIYVFYVCIVVYLFGDLAIYSTAVPKSMRDVACTYIKNGSNTFNMTEDDPCWASAALSRRSAYRVFVMTFAVLLGPFVFFNVQKTKYLQIITSLTCWAALFMMIILAIIWIAQGKNEGHPVMADVTAFPNIFGIAVYAFMCHHSLPGVVTPIRRKSGIFGLVFGDYFSTLILYLILALTGVFLYREPKDLYTLNFFDIGDSSQTAPVFIRYFLALFPVFTLSSTFPIIGITLRNNIRTLFGLLMSRDFSWPVERLAFPLMTLIPPICIALTTDEVQFLVGITGSYAGCAIQYVIPAMMVYCSRKFIARLLPDTIGTKLPYRSPFHHFFWIVIINLWAFASIIVITVNHIIYRR